MIEVAMMGFGTVGQGVYHILEAEKEHFYKLTGKHIHMKKILVKDLSKARMMEVPPGLLTDDPREILEDPAIAVILEVTGDKAFSLPMMKEALGLRKNMITANKAVVSEALEELTALSLEQGVSFLYEASVAGAAPILKVVKDQIRMSQAVMTQGILNGTCNYILTKMTKEGLSYEDALQDAQALGYSEEDPSDDVEGTDTKRKLRILSTLAFCSTVREEDILCEGIASITALDLALLRKKDLVVKLLGKAQVEGEGFQAAVLPWALKKESTFRTVDDSDNLIEGAFPYAGTLSVKGPGAGMLPTASAIWNDLLDCILRSGHSPYPGRQRPLKNENEKITGTYYLRLSGNSKSLLLPENLMEECLHEDTHHLAFLTKETMLLPLMRHLESIDPRQWVLIALS